MKVLSTGILSGLNEIIHRITAPLLLAVMMMTMMSCLLVGLGLSPPLLCKFLGDRDHIWLVFISPALSQEPAQSRSIYLIHQHLLSTFYVPNPVIETGFRDK